MSRTLPWPDRNRLSVLTAIIILAYALARFLDLPARVWRTTLLGSSLEVTLDGPFLMLLIVAALISTGAEALIRSHPFLLEQPTHIGVRHWILPGLTALILGAALNRLTDPRWWWVGLSLSVLALLAVLIAEYVTVDPADPRRDGVSLAVTALAYALAVLAFTFFYSLSYRALISASLSGVIATSLAWRLLALKAISPGRGVIYAALVGVVCAEVFWALTYWRLPPTAAALLVMIPFYVGAGIAQQHLLTTLSRRVWVEYGVVFLVGLAIALAYAFFGNR
jgi:hypothetical protein